jgi:DNA primase
VLANSIIFVVEGEKDVETLRSYGFTATTNAGGAPAAWLPSYTDVLHGREVILIPDADLPGRRRVLTIARALLHDVVSLSILQLDGAKDVTEWFAHGHSELELITELQRPAVKR